MEGREGPGLGTDKGKEAAKESVIEEMEEKAEWRERDAEEEDPEFEELLFVIDAQLWCEE